MTDGAGAEAARQYLDVDGAAQLLGVSRQTVAPLFEDWRRTGGRSGIPHVRVGQKLIRTTAEDVRRWYERAKRAGEVKKS